MPNVDFLNHYDCFKSGQVLVSLVFRVCLCLFVFVDCVVNDFHTG